jgi:cephalosporin hydroxylase
MTRENIPGWDTYVHIIYDRWLALPPRRGAIVVEVGVALGKTITYLADRLLAAGRTDVEVWAVDNWAGNMQNGEQQEFAKGAGGDFTLFSRMMLDNDQPAFEFVRPIRAASMLASRLFDDRSVDLVVLDADHSYEAVKSDLACWIPKLRPDGWIGGDDHNDWQSPGVIQACVERFGAGNYELSEANQWNWPVWLKTDAGAR